MKRNKIRGIVKSIVWELTVFVISTVLFSFFMSVSQSIYLNLVLAIIKGIGLYFYLRLWKRSKWYK